MSHEIIKEFWKNIHFEKMTAGFLQRCQNSLRWNTLEIKHFQAGQKLIFTNIAPWYLFLSLNVVSIVFIWYFGQFFWTIKWPKDIFHFHESIFQWHNKLISHRSQFWHLRKKPAVIFSKRMFFQNSLVISWAI